MSKLNRCRFCGSANVRSEVFGGTIKFEGVVACQECGASVHKIAYVSDGYTEEKTRELVEAAWNGRNKH